MKKGSRAAAKPSSKKVERDGKTYIEITDYEKLRGLFGDMLHEIQRIKSEGDYAAGKALVENYGVKVDQKTATKYSHATGNCISNRSADSSIRSTNRLWRTARSSTSRSNTPKTIRTR